MEDRRPVHYSGNTVKLPQPGKKNMQRRERLRKLPLEFRVRYPDHTPKTAAADRCVWCDTKFKEYRLICRGCHCCLYCGLVYERLPSLDICDYCGNQWDA